MTYVYIKDQTTIQRFKKTRIIESFKMHSGKDLFGKKTFSSILGLNRNFLKIISTYFL